MNISHIYICTSVLIPKINPQIKISKISGSTGQIGDKNDLIAFRMHIA